MGPSARARVTEEASQQRKKSNKIRVWSQQDEQTLIERMQSQLPARDRKKYWKRVARIDWQSLRFGKYSAEDLKSKWTDIETKVRTHRTLTELLSDAMNLLTESVPPDPVLLKSASRTLPDPGAKISGEKIGKEQPLAPVDGYIAAKRERYTTRHPDLSDAEVSNALSAKFDRLPDHRKQKYIDAYEDEIRATKLKRAESRNKDANPVSVYRAITPDDDVLSVVSSQSAISLNKWTKMSAVSKEKYFQSAVKKGKTASECGPQLSLIDTQILQNLMMMMPKAPPRSGYSLYYQVMQKRLKSMHQVAEEWKKVSQEEKDGYHQKYKAEVVAYERDIQKLKSSLKPDTLLLFETYVEKKTMKSIMSVVHKALDRLQPERTICKTNGRKRVRKNSTSSLASSLVPVSDTESTLGQELVPVVGSQEVAATETPSTKPRIKALKMTPLDEMSEHEPSDDSD